MALLAVGVPAVAIARIDPWPKYQAQTTCSPTAKPGTKKLAAWLQHTYRGSGSYGISRACGSGGRSEHKEGRAFDWRVNATRPVELRYAQDFLRRLFATDKNGNPAALARRMGIMYVIWNDHIYSATYRYRKRAYRHAACATVKGCSQTLRHRDHMHISLTWAGARAQTSWYKGVTVTPAPAPTPDKPKEPTEPKQPEPPKQPGLPPVVDLERHDGAVTVEVPTRGRRLVTPFSLARGRTYKVTAFGLTQYDGSRRAVADPACVWHARTGTWRTKLPASDRRKHGSLDLYVGGRKLFADEKCSARRHLYTDRIRPASTGPLAMSLDHRSRPHGEDRIKVMISSTKVKPKKEIEKGPKATRKPVAGEQVTSGGLALMDEFDIDADETGGELSDEVLQAGVTYRVTVSGVLSLGGGFATDGTCVRIGDRWSKGAAPATLWYPDADHGQLYLNGVAVNGTASAEDPTGCTAHTREFTYTPVEDGRIRMGVWDPTPTVDDNYGDIDVRISRVTPVPTVSAPAEESPSGSWDWRRDRNTFEVDAEDADGTVSSMRLRKGEKVTLIASGAYKVYDNVWADASCTAWGGSSWRSWVTRVPSDTGQDLFGLQVNGADVSWFSLRGWKDPEDGECSNQGVYVAEYTAPQNGPVRFSVFDLDYRDNDRGVDVMMNRR